VVVGQLGKRSVIIINEKTPVKMDPTRFGAGGASSSAWTEATTTAPKRSTLPVPLGHFRRKHTTMLTHLACFPEIASPQEREAHSLLLLSCWNWGNLINIFLFGTDIKLGLL
jgi:hypothetical protein